MTNKRFTGWPVLIVWSEDTPESVLPHVADWRRLGEDDQPVKRLITTKLI